MYKQYDLVRKTTKKQSLIDCIDVYIATMSFLYIYQIKTKMKIIKNKLNQISIKDVHYHWRFNKNHSINIVFIKIDFIIIATTLTTYLEIKFFKKNDNINNCNLLNLNTIIFRKIIINKNIKSLFNINDFEKNKYKKISNNNETLRFINNSRIIKTKNHSLRTKNKKETMSRAIKTKI